AEPGEQMRRYAAEPFPSNKPAGKSKVGPASPVARADRDAFSGLHSGDHPGADFPVPELDRKAAACDSDRDRTGQAFKDQAAHGDFDARKIPRVAESHIGGGKRRPIHRTGARHAEAHIAASAGILDRDMRASKRDGEGGFRHRPVLASNWMREIRWKRTRSPTSNRNGRSGSS